MLAVFVTVEVDVALAVIVFELVDILLAVDVALGATVLLAVDVLVLVRVAVPVGLGPLVLLSAGVAVDVLVGSALGSLVGGSGVGDAGPFVYVGSRLVSVSVGDTPVTGIPSISIVAVGRAYVGVGRAVNNACKYGLYTIYPIVTAMAINMITRINLTHRLTSGCSTPPSLHSSSGGKGRFPSCT